MKKPTEKMVCFATAIHNAGFTPDNKSFDEIIGDFDLCFRFIGQFKDSYLTRIKEAKEERETREWLRRRQDSIHSNLMRAAWEYETEIMKEYFGPESLWRWDGL